MFPFCAFCQLCDTQDDVTQTLSGGVAGAGMRTRRGCAMLPPGCVEVSVSGFFFLQMETWTSWRKN